MTEATFVTDLGGYYLVRAETDGTVTVQGARSNTVYCSPDTWLEVTGKERRHTGVGIGRRAVLHLDTGEGISRIRGVLGRER